MIPWIYLFYNEDFNSVSRSIIRLNCQQPIIPPEKGILRGPTNPAVKRLSQNSTISRSDMNFRNYHTSANMNRSNNPIIGNTGGLTALNGLNSNINECNLVCFDQNIAEMEVEFGYCTEEESIFQSFSQEIEKIVPRITRTFSMKKDQKNVRIGFEDVVRKVSMP